MPRDELVVVEVVGNEPEARIALLTATEHGDAIAASETVQQVRQRIVRAIGSTKSRCRTLRFHLPGEGPFAGYDIRLKHTYVQSEARAGTTATA